MTLIDGQCHSNWSQTIKFSGTVFIIIQSFKETGTRGPDLFESKPTFVVVFVLVVYSCFVVVAAAAVVVVVVVVVV